MKDHLKEQVEHHQKEIEHHEEAIRRHREAMKKHKKGIDKLDEDSDWDRSSCILRCIKSSISLLLPLHRCNAMYAKAQFTNCWWMSVLFQNLIGVWNKNISFVFHFIVLSSLSGVWPTWLIHVVCQPWSAHIWKNSAAMGCTQDLGHCFSQVNVDRLRLANYVFIFWLQYC